MAGKPDYDVIVLGGGSAGTAAAGTAARAGTRTAMVNEGELGGLCILRGCMPTKAMLASAHALHETTTADAFGVRLEGRAVADFRAIMERKDAQVARFQRAKIASVEGQDYEVIPGRAAFAPGGGVTVDGRVLSARRYVIASGSEPVVLPLPGIDDVPFLTSDDVMRLERQPASLVVQGAGPIGLELAQFFARIGTEVVLVARSTLLHRYDLACGEELARALGAEPRLEVIAPGAIAEVRRDGDGLSFRIETAGGERRHRADALLMAAGRRAALGGLGLEHAGLEAARGCLEHDLAMRTANPDVFVAGDATGRYQILHLANQEGAVAGHNAAGAEPERGMDYRLKMSVVFTDPPFAHVGESLDEARARGARVLTGEARFPETGRAITMGAEHGLWRLFAEAGSGEILGSAILGPRADDLAHLVALMMHYGGRVADIDELPWYHPTLSEVMLNLGRDLHRKLGDADLPCPPPA